MKMITAFSAILVFLLMPVFANAEWVDVKTINTISSIGDDEYCSLKLNSATTVVEYDVSILKKIVNGLRSYFTPETKAFALVAEFTINGVSLPPIPFYSAAFNEKINDWEVMHKDKIHLTPYFPIDPEFNHVSTTIKAIHTDKTDSNIGKLLGQVTTIATAFVNPSMAAFTPNLKSPLATVDTEINRILSSSERLTDTKELKVAKGETIAITITDPTGNKIVFEFEIDKKQSLLSQSEKEPFNYSNEIINILNVDFGSKVTIRERIENDDKIQKLYLDENDRANSINLYCWQVENALRKDYGLNALDRAVVLRAFLSRHDWWLTGKARKVSNDECEKAIKTQLQKTNLTYPYIDPFKPPTPQEIKKELEKILFNLAKGLKSKNKDIIGKAVDSNMTVFNYTDYKDFSIFDDNTDYDKDKFLEKITSISFSSFGEYIYDNTSPYYVEINKVNFGADKKSCILRIYVDENSKKISTIKILGVEG